MEEQGQHYGTDSLAANVLTINRASRVRRWGMRMLAFLLFLIPEPVATNFLGGLLLVASFSLKTR